MLKYISLVKNTATTSIEVATELFSEPPITELSPDFFEKLLNSIIDFIPNLITAVIWLVAGWILSKHLTKIIVRFIEKSKVDAAAVYFFKSLILVTLRIIVILVTLAQLGLNVSTIVTALGAATVTVGLALQDTLGNVASGILLIFTQPFKEGDYLKIGSDEGTVTKISLFSTHINTADNKEIVIPNRNVTSESVINYSSNDNRRVDLTFNIDYDNDLLATKKIIKAVIDKNKKIMHEKDTVIGVISQNDRCITIDVKFWCKNADYWDLYYQIEEEISVAFDENKVKLPEKLIVSNSSTKK